MSHMVAITLVSDNGRKSTCLQMPAYGCMDRAEQMRFLLAPGTNMFLHELGGKVSDDWAYVVREEEV